jgi:Nickel responsive protein SCO4226-like
MGSRADAPRLRRGLPSTAVADETEEREMPRYVVERTFPEGLGIPSGFDRATVCLAVVERNADAGVTWIHSYVSEDQRRTFCVYHAPTPEAIRKAAARNAIPVDRITHVRVLDPYFYA